MFPLVYTSIERWTYKNLLYSVESLNTTVVYGDYLCFAMEGITAGFE